MNKKTALDFVMNNTSTTISIREAKVLLCYILDISINQLELLNEVDIKDFKQLSRIIKRYNLGEPINKILGFTYFFGHRFEVNNGVLTPRFDTEYLVDAVIQKLKSTNKRNNILDLCTGSGCIATTIKNELPVHRVVASDISAKALKLARKNAYKNNVFIHWQHSDMFKNINEKFDIIVSNPPYIKSQEINKLDKEVKLFDPLISLDGGIDGLDFYKEIFNKIDKYLQIDGTLFLEIGYDQTQDVCSIACQKFNVIKVLKDLSGNDRIIIASSMKGVYDDR